MRICRLNSPEICLSKRSHNELCYRLTFCVFARTSVKFRSLIMLPACVSGSFGQSNSSFYVSNTGDDSNPGTQRHLGAPARRINSGSSQRRECPDVEEAEASPALVHLLPVQQLPPGGSMRSGQLFPGRQL